VTIIVRLLRIHKFAERFEKLFLGLAWNGIAVVSNANLEKMLGLCEVGGLDAYDSSCLANKFTRIRKQIDQHLLDTVHVAK
jgi:hypothetical protein